jgi:hypothetical protein
MRLFDEHALGVLQFLKLARKPVEPPARRVERQGIADKLGHRGSLARNSRPQRGQFALKLRQEFVRHDEIRSVAECKHKHCDQGRGRNHDRRHKPVRHSKGLRHFIAPDVKEARFDPGFLFRKNYFCCC